MRRPACVVAFAIVLAVVSVLQVMMALGMVLVASTYQNKSLVAAQSAVANPSAPLPGWMPGFMYGWGIFSLLLAAWGIATTIGVYRLRRWARYSILIIGGCMAVIGLVSLLSMLLIMAVPLPFPPGMDTAQAHSMQTVVRIVLSFVALLYAAVLAIGIRWLVYFNRKSVGSVFAGPADQIAESRPLLISVFAVLSIVGALGCIAGACIPIPAMLFGAVIGGGEKIALYIAFALLQLAMGIGIWRMAEWARRLALAFLALGALNTIMYLVRPSLMLKNMSEVHRAMQLAQPEMMPHFQNMLFAETFSSSLLLIAAIAYMLHFYRARFFEPDEKTLRPPMSPMN